jgi:hypothetical protein
MKTYLAISFLSALLYGGFVGAFFGATAAVIVGSVSFAGALFTLTTYASAAR